MPEPTTPILTAREIEILQYLARRQNVAEVAAHLGLKRKTADGHRTRIFRKLGRMTAAELLRYAIQRLRGTPPLTRPQSNTPCCRS